MQFGRHSMWELLVKWHNTHQNMKNYLLIIKKQHFENKAQGAYGNVMRGLPLLRKADTFF